MPNWCLCSLEIRGPAAAVEEFIRKNRTESAALSFSAQMPVPAGESDPCEWASEHWGTKWEPDVNQCEWHKDEGVTSIDMMTAWSPPIEWLVQVSRLHPELTFTLEYDEPSMDFSGKVEIRNGVTLKDDEAKSQIAISILAQQEQMEAESQT